MEGVTFRTAGPGLPAEAVAAGHDMVLLDCNQTPGQQPKSILAAVRSGRIPMKRVSESVRRILAAKQRIQDTPPAGAVDRERHRLASLQMSRQAMTAVGDLPGGKVPAGGRQVLFIVADGGREFSGGMEVSGDSSSGIPALLKTKFPESKVKTIPETPSPKAVEETLDLARAFETVVFVSCALPHSYKGTADLSRPQIALVRALREKIRILVLFGNPFAARELPRLPCILFAYLGGHVEQAAAEVLAGEFLLPESCPWMYKPGLDRCRPLRLFQQLPDT